MEAKKKFKYICPTCGKPNDWYEHSCYDCEVEGERQQENIKPINDQGDI